MPSNVAIISTVTTDPCLPYLLNPKEQTDTVKSPAGKHVGAFRRKRERAFTQELVEITNRAKGE